ncbi:MAG: GGDEF domain-containing protein [Clostridia bacterium]|nr:GGDEF domain-containing protein [Clostridia bacterium]
MENFIRSVARFIDNSFLKKRCGTHLNMSVRYFNIVSSLLCFFTALGSVFILCVSRTYAMAALLLVTSIFFMAINILGNSTKRYNLYMIICTYTFNLLFLPSLYFIGGGITYGVWLYFIAGLLLSVLFIRGPAFIITIFVQPLYYFILFFISYYFPEIIYNLDQVFVSKNFWHSPEKAIIINFVIISIFLGILIKSLLVSYLDERDTALSFVKRLENLSLKDPLTGIFNRRYLFSYLESAIKSSPKDHIPLCIVMYDIDNFKVLNDTYGHVVGDEVLRAVAKVLVDNCREYDIVSRYGGEEFIIVFPGAKESDAFVRADKIREDIESTYFSPSISKPVTISGGVAFYEPGMSASNLINIADSNMYIAKNSGRNRIAWKNGAPPPITKHSEEDLHDNNTKHGRRVSDKTTD